MERESVYIKRERIYGERVCIYERGYIWSLYIR